MWVRSVLFARERRANKCRTWRKKDGCLKNKNKTVSLDPLTAARRLARHQYHTIAFSTQLQPTASRNRHALGNFFSKHIKKSQQMRIWNARSRGYAPVYVPGPAARSTVSSHEIEMKEICKLEQRNREKVVHHDSSIIWCSWFKVLNKSSAN